MSQPRRIIDPLYIERENKIDPVDQEKSRVQGKSRTQEKYRAQEIDRTQPRKDYTYSWTKLTEFQLCELTKLPAKTIRFLAKIHILTGKECAIILEMKQHYYK